jgi:hypothetical protein
VDTKHKSYGILATLFTIAALYLYSVPSFAVESIEQQILRDRTGTSEELGKRLREKGPNASFPEFKPVGLVYPGAKWWRHCIIPEITGWR